MSSLNIQVTGAILGLLTLSAAGGAVGSSGCGSDPPRRESPSSPPDRAATSTFPTASEADAHELSENFEVEVRVLPSDAHIYLDGEEVGRGAVALRLARDGRTHELRIGAEGYLPERLVFADASPPSEVRLQAIRRPQTVESPPPRRALPPRAAPPPARATAHAAEADIETSGPPAHVAPPEPSPPAARAQPNIKIIEPEAPHVRVIE